MRYFLQSLFFALTAMLLQSCDACWGRSCKDEEANEVTLRILNAQNGSDLVFGPNRLYEREKIKFFSVTGGDTTFFANRSLRLSDNLPDSALLVDFYPKSDTAFIQLNGTDVDTLALTYGEVKSWCCRLNVVSSIRYNNANDTIRGSSAVLRK